MKLSTLYLFFFFSFILCSIVLSETETLKQREVLDSSTFLFSPKKTFTLGFKNLDNNGNTYSYLAIWYTDSMYKNPVWLGNRDTPISNNSGILTIDSSGRLVIKHNKGNPIVISSEQTKLNTTASLLETGNFVLRVVDFNGSSIRELWNSFDHPTDTLLPGMKLGFNHRNGKNWSLTSWQDSRRPVAGAFTLEWDAMNRRLVIRRRGVIYWSSGDLENGSFPHIMTDIFNWNYKFTSFSNASEVYFSYSLKYNEWTPVQRRTISGWRLNSEGTIFDEDRPSTIVVDSCYGYEDEDQQSQGCELWKQPICRKPGQKFELRSGNFMADVGSGMQFAQGMEVGNSSYTMSDCRDECWNDCDCVGYNSDFYDSFRCMLWSGKKMQFIQDNSGVSERRYVITPTQSKLLTIMILFIL